MKPLTNELGITLVLFDPLSCGLITHKLNVSTLEDIENLLKKYPNIGPCYNARKNKFVKNKSGQYKEEL